MSMVTKLGRLLAFLTSLVLTKSYDPACSHGLLRSHEKLKSLYLHYLNVYDN